MSHTVTAKLSIFMMHCVAPCRKVSRPRFAQTAITPLVHAESLKLHTQRGRLRVLLTGNATISCIMGHFARSLPRHRWAEQSQRDVIMVDQAAAG